MKKRNAKSAAPAVWEIPVDEHSDAMRWARQGGWRPVLVHLDRWAASALSAGLPIAPSALTHLGAAGLSRKGARIPLTILDKGLLSAVPVSWLTSAAANAQDELLAELVRRARPGELRAGQGCLLGNIKDRDALGWALRHGLLSSLDAFIAHGCQAPHAVAQFLLHPDEEKAAAILPRALALGSPRDAFPSTFSTYRLKPSYGGSSPSTPLEAALVRRLPALALALINAGADPASPARTRSYDDAFSTTALHRGLGELLRHTQPMDSAYAPRPREPAAVRAKRIRALHEEAMLALMARLGELPAWWVCDATGRRAAEQEGLPRSDEARRWLAHAEGVAYTVSLPSSQSPSAPRPRF